MLISFWMLLYTWSKLLLYYTTIRMPFNGIGWPDYLRALQSTSMNLHRAWSHLKQFTNIISSQIMVTRSFGNISLWRMTSMPSISNMHERYHADCILLHIHTEITQFPVPVETRRRQGFLELHIVARVILRKRKRKTSLQRDHFQLTIHIPCVMFSTFK